MTEVTLLALVHAHQGRREELRVHESRLLALVTEHGGEVRLRAAASARPPVGGGSPPDEVHVITFPHEGALEAFLSDPRRTAGSPVSPVARTTVWWLGPIEHWPCDPD